MNATTPFTLNASAAEATAAAAHTWTAYRALGRSQWFTPAEVERLQLAKARLLLGHCLRNVPYYREQLSAGGFVPDDLSTMEDFRRLPLLRRGTLQERFEDFHAVALPPDVYFTGDCKTSGTGGVAVRVFQTNVTDFWWWAFYLRDLEWSGIDPRGSLAAIRPTRFPMVGEELKRYQEGISQPYWALPLLPLIRTGPSHGMDIHQDPRRQLAWLRRVAPNYLLSYPSNLDFLAGLLLEEGERLPSLKGIQIVSETLTEEVRARIENAFGVPVKDMYSCGEAGYLASPCPERPGLHVHAEGVILEVLDDDGRPCPPGAAGKVVVTVLHNYLTPLVRYEIMDEAVVGETPCPCGRGLPLLAKVRGKMRPLFRLPDGRMKHSDGLTQQLRLLGGMHQHQIIQRAVDHFLVRVAPGRAWTPEHPERLRRLVQEHVGTPVRVEVEVRERLDLPPGGKLLDVVSELAPAADLPTPSLPGSKGLSQKGAEPPGLSRRDEPAGSPQSVVEIVTNAPHARTVLFGWELGAGLGHVRRLLPLARALAAHGCRPVFAVKDVAEYASELRDAAFPVYKAPVRPAAAAPSFLAVSYADVLAVRGFAAVAELAPAVRDWQALLDEVRPALVVCDHSPTLCLSAYGALPTVFIGDGFTLPPADPPTFPLMLPGRTPLVPEAELLAVVREVQARRGRPAPETLPGLFGRADRFLTVLPGMDPYEGMRQELPLGPLGPLAPPTPPPARPAYFAYLSAEAVGLESLLAGLARSGYPGIVYVRGATAGLRGRLRKPGQEFVDAPLPPAAAVAGASVVVHHAGVGLAQHALSAGRPQLVFPGHLEQILNAQLLHRLGVGQYVLGQAAEDAAAGELQRLIRDRAAAQRAAARAAALRAKGPWDSLPRITEHCLVLMGQGMSPTSSN